MKTGSRKYLTSSGNSIRILLLLILCTGANAWTQTAEKKSFPNVYYSLGYQYAYFGNSLTGNQIDMFATALSAPEGSEVARNYQHAYGLVLRMAGAPGGDDDSPFRIEVALTNKKVLASQSLEQMVQDPSTGAMELKTIDTRYKTRIRALNIGTSYHYKQWGVGGSLDIGMFSSLRKLKGIGGDKDGKWIPWFANPKLFGSGYSGKTPVVGATLHASWYFSQRVELRIYKQFTLGLAGELSDRYFSLGNVGVELNIIFPTK